GRPAGEGKHAAELRVGKREQQDAEASDHPGDDCRRSGRPQRQLGAEQPSRADDRAHRGPQQADEADLPFEPATGWCNYRLLTDRHAGSPPFFSVPLERATTTPGGSSLKRYERCLPLTRSFKRCQSRNLKLAEVSLTGGTYRGSRSQPLPARARRAPRAPRSPRAPVDCAETPQAVCRP